MEQKLNLKQRLYRKICYKFCRQLPDEMYIKMMYYVKLGHKCDLKNPKTFDEKINYLKLHDRKPEYTMMADKYAVREYVKDRIGEEYLIPLLGVWDKPEDIDINTLPDSFVLKCTHDSGSVVICKDKSDPGQFDKDKAFEILNKGLTNNYYYQSREWPYKDIHPRIIAEEYMVDESGDELKDYKVYCFNGKPRMIHVDFGRFTKHERNFYDTKWNYVDTEIEYPKNPDHQIQKPEQLDKMLELASKLSEGTTFLRTDFYSINGKLYFGEITFYPDGGYTHFHTYEEELKWGSWITL